MRVLVWHVHGGYLDALVRGDHEWILPRTPLQDAWGLGLGGRDWPRAREVDALRVRDEDVDVAILQRPEELPLAHALTGRRPGRDLPVVYLEHNAPRGDPATTRHPLADRDDLPVVHVTHLNDLYWDTGSTRTVVIEHGVADPGHLYSGELPRAGAVVNEPVRRWRVTGTDLLPGLAEAAPIDVFGMGGDALPAALGPGGSRVRPMGDLPPARLHAELARRRVYLHPFRWTSLGLALLEAMHLGMPVVALATTEVPRAVPPDAGVISASPDELRAALRDYLADPDLARATGESARRHVLARYGLDPFLRRWDDLLREVVDDASRPRTGALVPSAGRSTE